VVKLHRALGAGLGTSARRLEVDPHDHPPAGGVADLPEPGVLEDLLVGSTSNPVWYAEQLAAIPAAYRIVSCPELQEAARVLGERLLTAAGRAAP
jgi:hypothetical protein